MATVGDFVVKRLEQWGVTRIYGYPGDGINGVFGALDRAGGGCEFVQARHEEAAALMACAHAKFTGEVGVVIATSGPGAIHLLNGLYDAKLDHQPVVAIVGQQPRSAIGGDFHQEVTLETLFADVCAYSVTVNVPEQARHAVDRAMRIARAGRTVTCVVLPNDVQQLDAVEMPPHEHGTLRTSSAYSEPLVVPHDDDLDAAARILNEGSRVAMLIGAGARGAVDELVQVADVLGAGIAKALLGKDVLSDELPFVTGAIGLLGTRPSWELMRDCDTLLMIGSDFPYGEFLPEADDARGVQIDLDPHRLGIRFPMEQNLVGDAAETLRLLLPRLRRKTDRAWRESVEGNVQQWKRLIAGQAHEPAHPINPQLVAHELSARLPDRSIVTADSGTSTFWYARFVQLREGMRGSLSGQLASMGVAVPYAIAAKFAHPTRPVVAFVGDGSMQMNGMAELVTIAKYRERWSDQRLVVAVLNNSDLNLVTWEQRVMSGDPRFEASQSIPDVHYADFAQSIGLAGRRIDRQEDVADAWEWAFAQPGPVVLDFVTDPDVPPLPPHITFEQAKNMMFSLADGDGRRTGVIVDSVRQMKHFVTGR